MSTFRKLLLSLLLVSLTGSAFGAGTFASFTASTTNTGSTFASGSLVLSNQVASATACLSSGATDVIGDDATDAKETAPNASNCDAIFDGMTAHKPGQFAKVNLTLENKGNVIGSNIFGKGLACTPGNVSAANGAADTPYKGSGDPCGYLTIQIQEWADSNRTSALRCLYPALAGACATANTINTFVTDTATTAMEVETATLIDVDPNAPRYLTVRIDFPNSPTPGFENQFMGRTATFGILWTLEQ